MSQVPGFSLGELLHEGRRSVLYRATRVRDGRPVVLKMMNMAIAAERVLVRLRHELEVLRFLNGRGAIHALELLSNADQPVLVLEDVGGTSLRAWMKGMALGVRDALVLGGRLVAQLQQVHAQRVIHKDLNPSNILVIERGGAGAAEVELRLIDFGIAATLSRETPSFKNPTMVEGTLPYIAPEQTGRMNRSVDYRADLYSLGICLYELLTGTVPFTATDPLALIYCHLAQPPEPPHVRSATVPKAVSAVVMKLLAKDAESRYQSLEGLQADLTRCLEQLDQSGWIAPFEPGLDEQPLGLQLPQNLYGRENEAEQLLAAFSRVCEGNVPGAGTGKAELLLVMGESGVGKSSLVRELHKPITQRRGLFLAGKFDPYQGSAVPYSAFARAFDAFCHYLLTESEEALAGWRKRILRAVGENGQVIIELVPSLEAVIGPQPALSELDPLARQNRFQLTFQQLLSAVCHPEHPLVLFIDDLQWADGASLKLLETLLVGSGIKNLLLIGAYRDNEVRKGHPLLQLIEDTLVAGVMISTLRLGNLTVDDVTTLVADTLKSGRERVQELANLVYAKTRGNAFFVHQFLHSLHEAELLVRRPTLSRNEQWSWDITAIRGRSATDNVVEFLEKRLEKLPPRAREVLEVAACLGGTFELKTLALVANARVAGAKTPPDGSAEQLEVMRGLLRELWPAIDEELIIPSEQAYKVVRTEQPDAAELAQCSFSFQHDRVHQAVYAGIPEQQRQLLHLEIGRRLLAALPSDVLERRLFEVADQYTHGLPLLTDPAERHRLAGINLRAGTKAKAANAHGTALQYLHNGLTLLPNERWEQDYALTLELHSELVEAAYLSGAFERMEQHAQEVLAHARELLDVIPVQVTRLQALQAQSRLTDTVSLSLLVLSQLGISPPANPTPEDLDAAFAANRALLGDRGAEEIAALPPMSDARLQAALWVASNSVSTLWNAAPALYPFVILELIQRMVRQGNTAYSAVFYANYGLIRCAAADDIDEAYRWALIANEVSRRFDTKRTRFRTMFVVYNFLWHWKHPIHEILRPLRETYTLSLENGDPEQAAWCLIAQGMAALASGRPLPAMKAMLEEHLASIARLQQPRTAELTRISLQSTLLLSGEAERPWEIVGEVYDERIAVEGYRADNNLVALSMLYCNRLIHAYLFGQYKRGLEDAKVLDTCIMGPAATVIPPLVNLYDSLTRLALVEEMDAQERAATLERVELNQQRLRMWAQHAPMNQQHRYELVDAELARVRGDRWRAVELYQAAIRGAHLQGFVREEAVANERASLFWQAQDNPEYALMHLRRARRLYESWGSTAKLAALMKRHAQLELMAPLQRASTVPESSQSSTAQSSSLDVLSIIRSARAISSEIVLSDLMHTVLRIIRENVGAQYGALVDFDERQGWLIRCQTENESRTAADLPMSVLHYVRRTLKPVVLDDASTQPPYSVDAVVRARGLRSVLCIPLVYRERHHGLLYLENSLATQAFSEARQGVVEILAAQAAVALDNAQLYHHMAEQNRALESSRGAIESAQRQIQDIIDNSPAVIFVKDLEGRYLLINSPFEKRSGLSREDLLGKRDADVFPAEHARRLQENDRRVAESGTTLEFEEDVQQGDEVRTFLALKFPMRTENQRVYAICGISTDITDRKRAEIALQQANEELERRVNERTEQLHVAQLQLVDRARHAGMFEIASSILHNLGNALNSISVSSTWLREHVQALPIASLGRLATLLSRPSAELAKFLTEDERGVHAPRFLNELHRKFQAEGELLLKETDNLSELVEHVHGVIGTQQQYARTRITLRERLCLHELVEDALRLCAIGGHFDNIIQREYGDEQPELYERHVIVQILVNLITNAKNAVLEAQSGNKPRITISVHQDATQTTVTVSDNGIGFDEGVKSRLFSFGFTMRAKGHGFGLHSAALSAQSLGGRIEAHSEGPGLGAKFQLILPRASS
ncbi:AAA family ATPase [Hyalangium rubrum]|uniref:AAA family ATPase n=1 Tax=Hyalangium rubrum TaxID=3103134 RepID=A0ABU5H5E6_9BACT|nr:AAA family ATPase [Hyalangium sp. s54d21]MDY7228309.1 AAA family ATPase [Hyalangium sp. s54d21]